LILIILAIFSLSISQAPGPLMKTGAAALLMLALLMPITRQFFLPALPIFTWLLFFFNARYVSYFLQVAVNCGPQDSTRHRKSLELQILRKFLLTP
jgi:hypothetical protein